MLSDRPYMRGDYPRETTSVATWLGCALAGAFTLQFVADSRWLTTTASGGGLASLFAFSIDGFVAGRIWTPFTHWLLHSTSNLFHVGLSLAGVFLLGRELAKVLSTRRFLAVFAASIMTGAAVWSALHWRTSDELIGATAGLYGLVAVYALLYPNREICFLLFFFFPVTIRPKHLAVALLVAESFALLLIDILNRSLPFTYAPSAHLGGMFAGWAYYQFFHETEWQFARKAHAPPREHAMSPAARSTASLASDLAESSNRSRENIRAQVDRVLDKINSKGLGALTPEERRILDDAKELLSRR